MRTRPRIEIAADPRTLFDLSQDYDHRLDWDPFLSEARLVDAEAPAIGVHAWCVSRSGIGMETRYVSFRPPEACAVEMTRGPWFLRAFAGSWRFTPLAPGRTAVDFTYHVAGRPGWITPILAIAFRRDSWRRLIALRSKVESA